MNLLPLLDGLNDILYTYYLIALLVFCGLFYTFRLGFIQFRLFIESIKVVTEKAKGDKSNSEHISPFQALMISTASRVGIGNIAGISIALTVGGSGAIFWLWVMAFFGGASAFAESTLAQVYKSRDSNGFKGGPAYYISKALNLKWLGYLFAVVLILTYAYGFNGLQSYTMTSSFEIYYNKFNNDVLFADSNLPIIIGIILTVVSAMMFFSKSHVIGKISAIIVPYMALAYIALAIIATCLNLSMLPSIMQDVISKAFDFQSIFGGFAGSAIVIGIKRGLFSNEAGMGSAPNAAASAHTSHPVKQGLVQTLSVFIDVVVCSSTAFLVLFSYAYINKVVGVDGNILTGLPLVQTAMQEYFGESGLYFVTIAVVLFAVTSLIGNYYYAHQNMKYLTDSKFAIFIFRLTCVFMVFAGSQFNLALAWTLADVLMALMATINIVAILLLSKVVVKTLNDYLEQRRKNIDPVFSAKKLNIKNAECWD